MTEPISRNRTADRDFQIWQRYTGGETQTELAAAYGISQVRVSQIIGRMKDDTPIEERRARQARALADLDQLRRAALDLVEAEPIPAYSNGRPIELPDNGGVAKDHSARIRGMELALKVMERQAKALGTDAVTRVSVDAENLGAEILGLLGKLGTADEDGGK